MKKLLPVASFLLVSTSALLLLRASAPAQAAQQPGVQAQGLEARVAALEMALAAEKQRNDETRAQLEQTLAYLDKQAKAAQTLLGVLDESEAQGFAMGENWHSRETLLAGLRAYWRGAEGGLPKPAAPAKPAPPQRPVRK